MSEGNGTGDLQGAIMAMQARRAELAAEMQRLDVALEQLARFVRTPTAQEHRTRNRQHTPIPMRQKRIDHGVSAKTLADALGITHSYLSQIETGSRPASDQQLQRWEAKLDELIKAGEGKSMAGQQAS